MGRIVGGHRLESPFGPNSNPNSSPNSSPNYACGSGPHTRRSLCRASSGGRGPAVHARPFPSRGCAAFRWGGGDFIAKG